MSGYSDLMNTLPEVAWEVGDDPEHPGRFCAVARWDNHETRMHESITAVNEATPESAVQTVIDEYRHVQQHPELHRYD